MTGPFTPKPPLPTEIKAYREEHQCGLIEARNAVQRRNFYLALDQLRQSGTLEEKVEWLLDRIGAAWNVP